MEVVLEDMEQTTAVSSAGNFSHLLVSCGIYLAISSKIYTKIHSFVCLLNNDKQLTVFSLLHHPEFLPSNARCRPTEHSCEKIT